MSGLHHVYLVPGFFGFAHFGELKYFAHVRGVLEQAFQQAGAQAALHYVPTHPTASLTWRATRLLEVIRQTAQDAGPIHIVGHSSGGMDARLLTTPGVSLPGGEDVEDLARRVRSVVCLASPHRGTPLAALFNGLVGQQLLRTLSAVTLHGIRLGAVPAAAVLGLLDGLQAAVDGRAQGKTFLQQIYQDVLADFDPSRRDELDTFFSDIRDDQGLLTQLTPEGATLFDATAAPRPGTRYGSVVCAAPRPRKRDTLLSGLSPTAQAQHALFRVLHSLTAADPAGRHPPLLDEQADPLLATFGPELGAGRSDAIVPVRSQVHGTVIHAAVADHLDIIGHFHAPASEPPHVDWIRTLSGFDQDGFVRLWRDVCHFALDAASARVD